MVATLEGAGPTPFTLCQHSPVLLLSLSQRAKQAERGCWCLPHAGAPPGELAESRDGHGACRWCCLIVERLPPAASIPGSVQPWQRASLAASIPHPSAAAPGGSGAGPAELRAERPGGAPEHPEPWQPPFLSMATKPSSNPKEKPSAADVAWAQLPLIQGCPLAGREDTGVF